jgi:hypothetical protein
MAAVRCVADNEIDTGIAREAIKSSRPGHGRISIAVVSVSMQ